MGDLEGDVELWVIAHSTAGLDSDAWIGTIHVVPYPSWLGDPEEDDHYDFRDG